MAGWWNLKVNLNPLECLKITQEDVLDFIEYTTKDEQITEGDLEHIYQYIREGYTCGQINDWDRETIKVEA